LEGHGIVRLSIDELIRARHGRLGKDYPASEHLGLLAPVIEDARRQLAAHVRAGRSAVYDHGLGHRDERESYKRLVTDNGGRWRLVYFPVATPELLRRLAIRNEDPEYGEMPPDTLMWMADVFERPAGEGEELPDAVLLDRCRRARPRRYPVLAAAATAANRNCLLRWRGGPGVGPPRRRSPGSTDDSGHAGRS